MREKTDVRSFHFVKFSPLSPSVVCKNKMLIFSTSEINYIYFIIIRIHYIYNVSVHHLGFYVNIIFFFMFYHELVLCLPYDKNGY